MVDRRFEDGETIDIHSIAFKTFLVPGHTNGSAFFLFTLDEKRMVVTGDTVLPEPGRFDYGIEAALGWQGSYELDKERYIRSLEKVLHIEADILLGGHGIPVMIYGGYVIRKAFVRALEEYRS